MICNDFLIYNEKEHVTMVHTRTNCMSYSRTLAKDKYYFLANVDDIVQTLLISSDEK